MRDILAIDPQHIEVHNNLTVLLRERQRQAADTVFAGALLPDDF